MLAARLGYPLLVKAAAGGGGRGIRMVHNDAELAAALPSARAEAQLAFGDPTVFLEKLVPAARHVEVQVIADDYGTAWAVGVRDCTCSAATRRCSRSRRRRCLTPTREQAIRDAAVRLAAAAGYRNAGTVEFLVDPDTGELPVHGGQHPAAGRAPGDRGDHRAGLGQAAAPRGTWRAADRRASRTCPGTRSRRG